MKRLLIENPNPENDDLGDKYNCSYIKVMDKIPLGNLKQERPRFLILFMNSIFNNRQQIWNR